MWAARNIMDLLYCIYTYKYIHTNIYIYIGPWRVEGRIAAAVGAHPADDPIHMRKRNCSPTEAAML